MGSAVEDVGVRRTTAVLGWTFVGALVVLAAESVRSGELLWSGLALLAAAIVAAPAVVARDWSVIVSWPLPFLAVAALLFRTRRIYPEIAAYVALTAMALVVVAEIVAFTDVEMSGRFAAAFAVLTTMALQAVWTVAQFYSDRWLETAYLRSQTELQWDFVFVTLVATVVGVVFQRLGFLSVPVGPGGPDA